MGIKQTALFAHRNPLVLAIPILTIALAVSGLYGSSAKAAEEAWGSEPESATASHRETAAGASTEQMDRTVDRAALGAQGEAIHDLREMIAKYRGTPREAALLFKLGEVVQQSAEMQFRVAHGAPGTNNQKSYEKVMKESIAPLSRLIESYPNSSDMAHAWFMRAKAYDETGAISSAQHDYLHLTRHYPSAPETVPGYMALAKFATRANQHKLALSYLGQVKAHPENPYYPHALYEMAWANHLLGNPRAALEHANLLIAYYKKNPDSNADQALRETALQDIPTFYFAGFEKDRAKYSLNGAFDHFQHLETGSELPVMTNRFAQMLRAHDYEKELNDWRALVVLKQGKSAETLELVLVVYEYQLNHKLYGPVAESSKDIVKLAQRNGQQKSQAVNPETQKKAESLLLETATQLQKRMVAYQGSPQADMAAAQLAVIYDSFSRIVEPADPRLRTIRANLAETLFATKQYEKAVQNYRWVIEQGSWSENEKTPAAKTGGITVPQASLKAISSRYEALREAKIVPTELKALSLDEDSRKKVDPRVTEWLSWIDTHVSKTGQSIDNFQFEANRTLYVQSHVREAIDRLTHFALTYPQSSYAIPSATLVVDTLIEGRRWETLEQVALRFAAVDAWSKLPFSQRVTKLAADAKFKQAESAVASKDYEKAVDRATEFAKKYPKSPMVADAYGIAGNSALAMNNRDMGVKYLAAIVAAAPGTESSAKALLAMGKLEEERYQFSEAAKHYSAYLALPARANRDTNSAQKEALRKRVLILSWASGNIRQLNEALASKAICSSAERNLCERLGALQYLTGAEINTKTAQIAAHNATRSAKSERAIWAAVALEKPQSLTHSSRNAMIAVLARSWQDLDSMSKFTLLTRISKSVPETFAYERELIQKSGELKANARSLSARMRMLKGIEDEATIAASLPWSRIRASVLSEVAAAYSDMITDIQHIPAPRSKNPSVNAQLYAQHEQIIAQLVAPFNLKARKLREQSFSLQARNQSHLELSILAKVDPQGDWDIVNDNKATPAQLIRAKWGEAIRKGQWQRVGFFMQEADSTHLIPAQVSTVAKAVSLAAAGAQAEANLALTDACHGRAAERIRAACDSRRSMLLGRN